MAGLALAEDWGAGQSFEEESDLDSLAVAVLQIYEEIKELLESVFDDKLSATLFRVIETVLARLEGVEFKEQTLRDEIIEAFSQEIKGRTALTIPNFFDKAKARLLDQITEARKAKDFGAQIVLCEELIARHTLDDQELEYIHGRLAKAHRKLGHFDESIEVLRGFTESQTARGLNCDKARVDLIMSIFNRVLKRGGSKDLEALVQLGTELFQIKDAPYRKTVFVYSRLINAHEARGDLRKALKYARGLYEYQRYMGKESDSTVLSRISSLETAIAREEAPPRPSPQKPSQRGERRKQAKAWTNRRGPDVMVINRRGGKPKSEISESSEKNGEKAVKELLDWLVRLKNISKKWNVCKGHFTIPPDRHPELLGQFQGIMLDQEAIYGHITSVQLRNMIEHNLIRRVNEGRIKPDFIVQVIRLLRKELN